MKRLGENVYQFGCYSKIATTVALVPIIIRFFLAMTVAEYQERLRAQ